MGIRFRKRPAVGPLRLNITERGLRSVSLKIGPFTWNSRRRAVTTDLPGGLYHVTDLDRRPCRCTHPKDVHTHHRDGTDCSQCGCRAYRRAR